MVVALMGVLYTFAIGALERVQKKEANLLPTLEHLKSYLAHFDFEKEARLVCYDECRSCLVVLDRNKTSSVESFLHAKPKLFRYDPLLGMSGVESEPYFDDSGMEHATCFSYRLYSNGVGEQSIFEYEKKVYDLSDYFDDAKRYDTLEELKEEKERLLQKVLS